MTDATKPVSERLRELVCDLYVHQQLVDLASEIEEIAAETRKGCPKIDTWTLHDHDSCKCGVADRLAPRKEGT